MREVEVSPASAPHAFLVVQRNVRHEGLDVIVVGDERDAIGASRDRGHKGAGGKNRHRQEGDA